MGVPYLACLAAAAAFYHLPPRVLPSIQAVEGGQVGMVHMNDNGTADLGPMQVNTVWLAPLSAQAKLLPGEVALRLVNDPCFNIAAAGAIVRLHLTEAHGNLIRAIGLYHSHSSELSQEYERKVLAAAIRLFVHPR